ncbi:alpha/beta hydrolase [Paracoccus sp. Z118]|uniref:alpha/beta hydrolase n=1 Tax=Paracoccus sp. Z118 TaxID=2851017 RepID=UPI001C2BFECE|nr:alpha/beta hydrolase [Paracoccus sp. Z118]MBV0893463.1 alpha/beta hydrolase [Paracoccus sp. Z118]
MADKWHVNWLREGVASWNSRRRKVSFAPDLSGVDLFELLPEKYRSRAKSSRFFERINLSKANLTASDLSRVNLSKANFAEADLRGANLSASSFTGANFKSANLTEVKAFRANFSKANFSEAVLEGANTSESVFAGANFSRLSSPPTREMLSEVEKQLDASTIFSPPPAPIYTADTASPLQLKKIKDHESGVRYDVYYGTNRVPIYTQGELSGFGADTDNKLNLGVCEVAVPRGHRIGSLGSPLWTRLFSGDDRLQLKGLIGLNEELFWRLLSQQAARSRVKARPTLFVHGYNTSFEGAILRAAQIGYDLGIGQGIALFSWPSRGTMRSYAADEAAVDSSKYHLADFIEGFTTNTEQKSVSIIAHSMGCRCLMGALEVLANGRRSTLKKIDQVILAAADIDTRHMRFLGRHATDYCKRTTSYVSSRDNALKLSGWLHEFDRVGLSPPTYILTGMDTIVVNDLELGGFGHGYIASSRTIINDVFQLLQANTAPPSRFSIRKISDAAGSYYVLNN